MKKKLLTVLLAVVMVFGTFGLVACGSGTNPDDDYNYYASKYNIEGEIGLSSLNYFGVQRMLTTAGNFLLYFDTETGSDAAKRIKAVNDVAVEWGVTIYHFNPDLSGGFASNSEAAHVPDLTKDFTNSDSDDYDAVIAGSQLALIQEELIKMLGLDTDPETPDNQYPDVVPDKTVFAVEGAAPTYSVPKSAPEEPKAGDYVAPETTYKASVTAFSYDKAADAVRAVAQRKPSFGQYASDGSAASWSDVGPEGFLTETVDTFNPFADGRLHMYNSDQNVDEYTADKTDVYVQLANYGQFAWLLDHNDGYFEVFFGNAWCGNAQAIAFLTNDRAKDYGIDKIYMIDSRLDGGIVSDAYVWTENEDGTSEWVLTKNFLTGGSKMPYANLNTRAGDATGIKYNFNYLYGTFLRDYLDANKEGGYESEWNIRGTAGNELNITLGAEGSAPVKFTRMCTPNIMLFNGEGENTRADLVDFAEAEYSYTNTFYDDNPETIAWNEAVSAVFEQNPYAYYSPLVTADEEAATSEEEDSSDTEAAAPPAGGSAC